MNKQQEKLNELNERRVQLTEEWLNLSKGLLLWMGATKKDFDEVKKELEKEQIEIAENATRLIYEEALKLTEKKSTKRGVIIECVLYMVLGAHAAAVKNQAEKIIGKPKGLIDHIKNQD